MFENTLEEKKEDKNVANRKKDGGQQMHSFIDNRQEAIQQRSIQDNLAGATNRSTQLNPDWYNSDSKSGVVSHNNESIQRLQIERSESLNPFIKGLSNVRQLAGGAFRAKIRMGLAIGTALVGIGMIIGGGVSGIVPLIVGGVALVIGGITQFILALADHNAITGRAADTTALDTLTEVQLEAGRTVETHRRLDVITRILQEGRPEDQARIEELEGEQDDLREEVEEKNEEIRTLERELMQYRGQLVGGSDGDDELSSSGGEESYSGGGSYSEGENGSIV